jgi:hypothetical protein
VGRGSAPVLAHRPYLPISSTKVDVTGTVVLRPPSRAATQHMIPATLSPWSFEFSAD